LIILDENILDGQRVLLEAWRLARGRSESTSVTKGLRDEELVVLLRQQRNPTFFTRDAGFYHRNLRHRNYCLVVAKVGQNEVAAFIRRFLRHLDFDTQARRMGRIVWISHAGMTVWRLRAQAEMHTAWKRTK